PLNFPIKLNNKIAALQGVVESADTRPTEQTYSVFRTLTNSLDEQLSKLDAAVKTKLPAVNQQLQRQKLDPIKPEPLKTDAAPAGTTPQDLPYPAHPPYLPLFRKVEGNAGDDGVRPEQQRAFD